MKEEIAICPYTGLRSFTEEESIFFKGRDTHIEKITRLLEKNKFLMVTGASGEGKSSLVYAGLIPNARAGFFKSRYPNWVVIDFRPERTPLRNLSKAIADKLSPDSVDTIETEIRRGFSSLIELYKNSQWYINESDAAWQSADEQEKRSLKRKAANLLIVADQFEEFFTNPENYAASTPSEDSQIVVNLMLETARIALRSDLPVYVVCTMRSDYIGQCTAFRGLPEYIGFSQFFVPRLKRVELQQIIEEPALLNDNRISKRLTERLLFDLSDGFDQLPILQHALSQIWIAAAHGVEEMDLIHYALVGGMPARELPDEDQPRFATWFDTLPDYQKELYKNPGIEKIIEIHASKLYQDAWTKFKTSLPDTEITVRDARKIIALTFACLTKIDDSRAVRNRMTVHEITQIINKPHLNSTIVGGVLNIFREPGNSFLRPFITEDPESHKLTPDAVLDITHESLIRNWAQLKKWADKEFEFYTTFLDFQKQLNRWVEKRKSSDFLLPIGPLTYFENWYEQCKPNKYWIDRYAGDPSQKETSLQKSESLLNDSQEFLKTSARKVMVTRTFMRYGANKIAAVLAAIVMLFLSSFYFVDARKKRNEHVVKELIDKSDALLASNEVEVTQKANYLIIKERHEEGSLLSYLTSLPSNENQLTLAKECYEQILIDDKHFKLPLKSQLIHFINGKINGSHSKNSDPDFLLRSLNNYCVLLSYDFYYNNQQEVNEALEKNVSVIHDLVSAHLSGSKSFKKSSVAEVNMGIQLILTFLTNAPEDLKNLINQLSPLEGNPAVNERFNTFYPKRTYETNGRVKVSHNGGYHLLATLYASTGNIPKVKICFDSLLADIDYYKGRPFNHYANVIGYLYQYNHGSAVKELMPWISAKTGLSMEDLYGDLIDRSGFLKYLYATNINSTLSESNAGYFHPNLCFINPALINKIFDDYEKVILSQRNSSVNFKLALLFKMRATFAHKYFTDRGMPVDANQLEAWLEKSFEYFGRSDEKFLSEKVTVTHRYYGGGVRQKTFERRQLYIYPDLIDRYISNTYYSNLFYQFLKNHQYLSSLYNSQDDLQLFNLWISNYYEVYTFAEENTFKNDYPLPFEDLISIHDFIATHPRGGSFDMNLINIILANHFFDKGDVERGKQFYHELNPSRFQATANMYDYLNKSFFYNQVKDLSIHLARLNYLKEAADLTESFERPADRVHNAILVAEALYEQNYNPDAFIFLDSAYSKMKKVNIPAIRFAEDFRFNQLALLGRINSESTNQMGLKVLKGIFELEKSFGIFYRIEGIASSGNFFAAKEAISKNLTETEELICYSLILYHASKVHESEQSKLAWRGMDEQLDQSLHYVFNFRGF